METHKLCLCKWAADADGTPLGAFVVVFQSPLLRECLAAAPEYGPGWYVVRQGDEHGVTLADIDLHEQVGALPRATEAPRPLEARLAELNGAA